MGTTRGRAVAAALAATVMGAGLAVGVGVAPGLASGAELGATGHAATSGLPVPGSYLVADAGTWSEQPDEVTYQWLRDGQPVAGATEPQLLLQAADVGHQLAPRVTARRGAETASYVGTPVTVRQLTSTLTLDVRRALLPGGERKVWVATASATSERPWALSGAVTVTDKGTVLASGEVVRDVAVVKLPGRKLRQGQHRLTACWAGNEAVAPSCSAEVVIHPRKQKHR